MRVSFKSFLTEGLIKLPASMKRALHDGIARSLAMYAYWNGDGEVKKKAEKKLQELGTKPVKTLRGNTAFVFSVPVDLSELPASYQKRNFKLPKSVTVKVLLVPLLHPDGSKEEIGGLYDPRTGRVTVGAKHFSDYVVKANDHHEFDSNIEVASSTGDHELSHFFQDRVLNAAGEGVEFDPQLKTELGAFKRLVKHNAGLGVKDDRRALEVFVGNKGPDAFWGSVTPATFFMDLKKKDETRWRKAVKLFTQNLSEGDVPVKIDPAVWSAFKSLVMHMTGKLHIPLKQVDHRAFESEGKHKLRIALDPVNNVAIVSRNIDVGHLESDEYMSLQWMTRWLEEWAKGKEVLKHHVGVDSNARVADSWVVALTKQRVS